MNVTSITTTHNDEGIINDCLNSIAWCDEHIIVDEYSSDETVDIAESRGATVYQKRTPSDANSYEILRKFAVEKASNDWILRLDADERSHGNLNQRIKYLVDKDAADVIMVPRKTFLCETWIDHGKRWWPDRVPMVFKKGAMEITDIVHRSLNIKPEAMVIELPADPDLALRHYSYKSILSLVSKRWRWSKLEGQVSDSPPWWYPFSALSLFLESFIVDAGYRNGLTGLVAATADAGYKLAVGYHSCR